ncbi:hypothetical protein H2200_011081 [Cladophialophora chaetospira]|uniref:Extracellular serine-rich protein n=1 Tax=Cladophialophora chaetospira TaxID=386627 RepID=A0AA38X026_9EURO|nr:hypothetical protein H2200_011081 [Cladophialophora chaetospira]
MVQITSIISIFAGLAAFASALPAANNPATVTLTVSYYGEEPSPLPTLLVARGSSPASPSQSSQASQGSCVTSIETGYSTFLVTSTNTIPVLTTHTACYTSQTSQSSQKSQGASPSS